MIPCILFSSNQESIEEQLNKTNQIETESNFPSTQIREQFQIREETYNEFIEQIQQKQKQEQKLHTCILQIIADPLNLEPNSSKVQSYFKNSQFNLENNIFIVQFCKKNSKQAVIFSIEVFKLGTSNSDIENFKRAQIANNVQKDLSLYMAYKNELIQSSFKISIKETYLLLLNEFLIDDLVMNLEYGLEVIRETPVIVYYLQLRKIISDLIQCLFFFQTAGILVRRINPANIVFNRTVEQWVFLDLSALQYIDSITKQQQKIYNLFKQEVKEIGKVILSVAMCIQKLPFEQMLSLDSNKLYLLAQEHLGRVNWNKPFIIYESDIFNPQHTLPLFLHPESDQIPDIIEIIIMHQKDSCIKKCFFSVYQRQQKDFQNEIKHIESLQINGNTSFLPRDQKNNIFQVYEAEIQLQQGSSNAEKYQINEFDPQSRLELEILQSDSFQEGKERKGNSGVQTKNRKKIVIRFTKEKNIIYEGQWENNLPNGKGTLSIGSISKQRSFWTYEGDFQDGNFHGQGKLIFGKSKILFAGKWERSISNKYLEKLEEIQLGKHYYSNNLFTLSREDQTSNICILYTKVDYISENEKVVDLSFSQQKDDVIDCLKVIIRKFKLWVTKISFFFKNSDRGATAAHSHSVEILTQSGRSVQFLFDRYYILQQEEQQQKLKIKIAEYYFIISNSIRFDCIIEYASQLINFELSMAAMQITDQFFYSISYNQKMQQLESIDLSRVFLISDAGFLTFLQSEYSRNLKQINISQTQLTDAVLKQLSQTQPQREILQLILDTCVDITQNGICAFLNSNSSRNLEQINFSNNDLTDLTMKAICDSKHCKKLKKIIFQNCAQLNFSNLIADLDRTAKFQLEIMDFQGCFKNSQNTQSSSGTNLSSIFGGLVSSIPNQSQIENYFKSQKANNLKVLNLSETDLTDKYFEIMGSGDSLKELQELYIRRCLQLTNSTIKTISNQQVFSNLYLLDISENSGLTGQAIKIVGQSKIVLNNLSTLVINNCEQIDSIAIGKSVQFQVFHQLSNIVIDQSQFDILFAQTIATSTHKLNQSLLFSSFQQLAINLGQAQTFIRNEFLELLSVNIQSIRLLIPVYKENQMINEISGLLNFSSISIQDFQGKIYLNQTPLGKYQLSMDVSNKHDERKNIQISKNKLDNENFSSETLKSMSINNYYENLRILNLVNLGVLSDVGIQNLSKAIFFNNLTQISFSHSKITNKQLQNLFHQKRMNSLFKFSIEGCELISFEGFEVICQPEIYDTLVDLNVNDTSIHGTLYTLQIPYFINLMTLNKGILNFQMQLKKQKNQFYSYVTLRDSSLDESDSEDQQTQVTHLFLLLVKLREIKSVYLYIDSFQCLPLIYEGMGFLMGRNSSNITRLTLDFDRYQINSTKNKGQILI